MTHVVAAIITKYDDPRSYLLVSSKKDFGEYSGYYYPPAGHIEHDEDELSALKRELKEELKIDITTAKKLAVTKGDVKNQKTSWYICDIEKYNYSINKKELSDAGFFTKNEMKSMKIWPATRNIFEKFVFSAKN